MDRVDLRISRETKIESNGSICIQPVIWITTPDTNAAIDPKRSPITWTSAARALTLFLSRDRTQATSKLTHKPIKATMVTVKPATGWGSCIRLIASMMIQATRPSMTMQFTKAASASARPKPKECLADGGRLAMYCASKARPKAAASVTI